MATPPRRPSDAETEIVAKRPPLQKKKEENVRLCARRVTARKGDVRRSSDDERGRATAAALRSLSASSSLLPPLAL